MAEEKVEYDNAPLIPYLREIHAAADAGGFPVADANDLWEDAKKIRQTMYIGKLAKKVGGKNGDCLVLTDKGREMIKVADEHLAPAAN